MPFDQHIPSHIEPMRPRLRYAFEESLAKATSPLAITTGLFWMLPTVTVVMHKHLVSSRLTTIIHRIERLAQRSKANTHGLGIPFFWSDQGSGDAGLY